MIFKGYSKTFSTINNEQYKLISDFWDDMLVKYNMEDLRGLGFNWTDTTIEYVIGLKDNSNFKGTGTWKEIDLPDKNWEFVTGKTHELDKIYSDIYNVSNLLYEIETFNNDNTCKIDFIREE